MVNRDDIGGLERGGIHAKTSRANIVVSLQTERTISLGVNVPNDMSSIS